jgi:hypothetical protein
VLNLVFHIKGHHRLRAFENRVLRRIFGPKRDEVTGECRKLHNKELHVLSAIFSEMSFGVITVVASSPVP